MRTATRRTKNFRKSTEAQQFYTLSKPEIAYHFCMGVTLVITNDALKWIIDTFSKRQKEPNFKFTLSFFFYDDLSITHKVTIDSRF